MSQAVHLPWLTNNYRNPINSFYRFIGIRKPIVSVLLTDEDQYFDKVLHIIVGWKKKQIFELVLIRPLHNC